MKITPKAIPALLPALVKGPLKVLTSTMLLLLQMCESIIRVATHQNEKKFPDFSLTLWKMSLTWNMTICTENITYFLLFCLHIQYAFLVLNFLSLFLWLGAHNVQIDDRYKLPWLWAEFQISQTKCKIHWLFSGLEKNSFFPRVE